MTAQLYAISEKGTVGSRRVNEYCNRNNVLRVTWEVTPRMDESLRAYQHEYGLTRSNLITNACAMFQRIIARQGRHINVPPACVRQVTKKATWYAPRDLHAALRHYSIDSGYSLQQLIDFAVDARYPLRQAMPES